MTPANSALIWSGVQKMWASLSDIARTRLSPPTTPERSKRYIVPNSAMRSGRSRYECRLVS